MAIMSYESVSAGDIAFIEVERQETTTSETPTTAPRTIMSKLARKLLSVWRILVQHVKDTPWRWVWHDFAPCTALPLVLVIGQIVVLLVFAVGLLFRSVDNSILGPPVCRPDGAFEMSWDSYDPWTGDASFSIDVNFGNMTFGQAKTVYIAWDLVVGRGGQGLAAITLYKVMSGALMRLMEKSSVPYNTFKAVTLQGNTLEAVYNIATSIGRSRRTAFTASWMVLASCFVLLMPTWLSAMTGYTTATEPYLLDADGRLVPAAEIQKVIYTIHDCSRLEGIPLEAYTSRDLPGIPPPEDYHILTTWEQESYDSYRIGGRHVPTTASLEIAIKNYINKYNTSRDEDSVLDYRDLQINLTSPTLNISSYDDSNPMFLLPSNMTYTVSDMNEHGSCLSALNVRYKWGFSFFLAFTFMMTWTLWTVSMWLCQIENSGTSRLLTTGRNMGLERAVLDLSLSMQKVLDVEDTKLYGSRRLQRLVNKTEITYAGLAQSEAVRFFASKAPEPPSGRSRRVIDEKYWLCAQLIFIFLMACSFFGLVASQNNSVSGLQTVVCFWCPMVSPLPVVGVMLVLSIPGDKIPARWLVFVILFVPFLAVNSWWIANLRRAYLPGLSDYCFV